MQAVFWSFLSQLRIETTEGTDRKDTLLRWKFLFFCSEGPEIAKELKPKQQCEQALCSAQCTQEGADEHPRKMWEESMGRCMAKERNSAKREKCKNKKVQ